MESSEKSSTTKGFELGEKIRNAAEMKFLLNLSDWKIAEAIKAIANRQLAETYNELMAMAPYARKVIQELFRDAPQATRLKAARGICHLLVRPTK
jgi:hypothetical protein